MKRIIVVFVLLALVSGSLVSASSGWSDGFGDETAIDEATGVVLEDGNWTIDNRVFYDNFTGSDGDNLDSSNWSVEENGDSDIGIESNMMKMWSEGQGDWDANEALAKTKNSYSGNRRIAFDLNMTTPWVIINPPGVSMGIENSNDVKAVLIYRYASSLGCEWVVETRDDSELTERDNKLLDCSVSDEKMLKVTIDIEDGTFEPSIRLRSDDSVIWEPGSFSFDEPDDWRVRLRASNNGYSGSNPDIGDKLIYWDNFTVTKDYGVGVVESRGITLPDNRLWDEVCVNKTVPTGTYVNVSVLDDTGSVIAGHSNLTGGVLDISSIDAVDYPVIRLRARLDGGSAGADTPVLHAWNVSWLEDRPVHTDEITDLHVPEDVGGDFNVSSYFHDYHGNLTYSLENDTTTGNVTLSFDGSVLNVSTIADDWYGLAGAISVNVSDGEFSVVSNEFNVFVDPVNDLPVIDSVPPSSNATVGEEWVYEINATDVDGDMLTYGHGSVGNETTFVSNGRHMTYVPVEADNGTYVDFELWVEDDFIRVWQNFSVWVNELDDTGGDDNDTNDTNVTNHEPVIISSPPTALLEFPNQFSDLFYYDVNATDEDGDVLVYSLDESPANMTIDSCTGEIEWRPTFNGTFTVTVNVTDGYSHENSTVQTFVIVVAFDGPPPPPPPPDNHPPTILTEPDSRVVDAGGVWYYNISATDVDNDPLVYGHGDYPSGMEFGDDNREIRYVPDPVDRGSYVDVCLWVTDGDVKVFQNFSIWVGSLNHAPIFESDHNDTEIVLGDTIDENLSVILMPYDPDGDALTWYIGGPDNATLSPDGRFIWTPNETGLWNVVVRVEDGRGGVADAHWTVNVTEDEVNPPDPGPHTSAVDSTFGIVAGVIAIGAGVAGAGIYASRRRSDDEKDYLSEEADAMYEDYGSGGVDDTDGYGEVSDVGASDEAVATGTATAIREEEEASDDFVPSEAVTLELRGEEYTEQDILSSLSSLPRGLPSEFFGKDLSELAGELMEQEYELTDDGDLVFEYDGKTYYGDPGKMGTYMQRK